MFGGRSGKPPGGETSLRRFSVAWTLEMWSRKEFLSKPKSWKSNKPSAYPPRRTTVRESRSRSSGLIPSGMGVWTGMLIDEVVTGGPYEEGSSVLRHDSYFPEQPGVNCEIGSDNERGRLK